TALELDAQLHPVRARLGGDIEAHEALDRDLYGDAHRFSCSRAARTTRRGPGSGSSSARSLRSPLACTRPPATASAQARSPLTSASQVAASVSTTAGGVPRVWRVP